MKLAAAALALAATAQATIDGTVVNRTSGRPAPGVQVRLIRMSAGGPEPVETVKSDPQGRFSFQRTPEAVHYVLEAQHQGVTYTAMLPPGATQRDVELTVYDVTRRAGTARLAQRIIFLEPDPGRLNVNETWLFNNDTRLTWHEPGGALRFFAPPEVGEKVTVMVTAPGGMPLPRQARRRRAGDLLELDFPIKPGETRFDLSYTLPTPTLFATRVPYPEAPTRLVVPAGVALKGEGLTSLGEDPSLRAMIYEVKGRKQFAVQIAGQGSLSAPAAEQDAGPSLEQILPRVYDRLAWILGPALATLALGFLLMYRSRPAGAVDRTPGRR